ncbi:MAG: putative histidine kinase, hybrid [Polaromonas sp.]|nr:putative histidine kinase, hybrid [Polaromonas sp.]
MPHRYMATSLPDHQVAELHRLMTEEIKEVAVFFMNPDGIITVWNRAAEEMKGFTAQDTIGSHLSMLYTDEDKARDWPQHNLATAKADGFYREESWRRRKDGSLFWARIALTALRDHSGELVGFSKITMDLTEHKLLERCVKEREETKRILRTANAGTWTWHPEDDRMEVCANFLWLLGHSEEGASMTFEQWMGFIEPRDRPQVAEKFARARASGPGSALVMETRMCQKDGGPCRWFYVHADWYRETEEEPFVLTGVNVDIQELRTAGDELHQAVDKLKEADARKDEFLAMLAHELRNPLAPVRSAAELLKIGRLDEIQVQKTSEIIARQVDHMTSLVDDLLDVSRVTRGLVELEKQPLDIRRITADAVEQVNPLIRARRHQLDLRLSPEPARVLGDQKRLVQVVGNLLNNAAKYTPEGGHIVLKTQVRDARVVVTVVDDGIGMEPALAARVFDLFAQAERTPDRSSGGLGLGLALVKSLVELHGGSVSCASQGQGKGSEFSVHLPLLDEQAARPEPAPAGPAGHPNKALRVMVVDDNEDAAQMLAMFLQASGHEVLVEYDARQALERARTEPADVFLLDIGLPEMDGNQLAQQLRVQPQTAAAVLIAITGYGQEHDRQTALASGFNYHFVKPVDPARLVALLSEVRLQGA